MPSNVKKPVNIFRLSKTGEPEGVFNWRLWYAVLAFGILGAARGIDEGLISGAFNSLAFQAAIHYDSYSVNDRANIKANVTAMVQIGSVGGAIIAFFLCDRVGRVWATRGLCLFWILGTVIFMAGGSQGSLGSVYAGRFIIGLGVGQTPVVGPVYLAEISPPAIRGLCTCVFTNFVFIGILLAYCANYGCSLHVSSHSSAQWLVPTSLHIMFATTVLFLSLFSVESPRYLIKRGKVAEATNILARLRRQPPSSPYVQENIGAIQAALEHEIESTSSLGLVGTFKEVFVVRSNFYRFYLAVAVQILSQWSGAGSITVYAPDLFNLLGITGNQESLFVSVVFGAVKLVAGLICTLFLVDVIGRKQSLLTGIALQAVAMIYIAAFLTKIPQLGVVKNFELADSDKGLSRGAVAMIYISGCGWALGWNSMQYLLTAELFPLRIRALATSMSMVLHFANQYGNSRALPNMLLPISEGGIDPKGTFWTLAAITLFGGLWVWFSVPETSGRSLEDMDNLFQLPWYKIGLRGNKEADEREAAEAADTKRVYVLDSQADVNQTEYKEKA